MSTRSSAISSASAVSRAWLGKLPAELRQLVIDEGAKLQPRVMAHSRTLDDAMRKRWTEAGGEFVPLSAADQSRVRQLLGGIGEEVTKENAAVHGFYRRLHGTAQKH